MGFPVWKTIYFRKMLQRTHWQLPQTVKSSTHCNEASIVKFQYVYGIKTLRKGKILSSLFVSTCMCLFHLSTVLIEVLIVENAFCCNSWLFSTLLCCYFCWYLTMGGVKTYFNVGLQFCWIIIIIIIHSNFSFIINQVCDWWVSQCSKTVKCSDQT